jgi:hypothetical protein
MAVKHSDGEYPWPQVDTHVCPAKQRKADRHMRELVPRAHAHTDLLVNEGDCLVRFAGASISSATC